MVFGSGRKINKGPAYFLCSQTCGGSRLQLFFVMHISLSFLCTFRYPRNVDCDIYKSCLCFSIERIF